MPLFSSSSSSIVSCFLPAQRIRPSGASSRIWQASAGKAPSALCRRPENLAASGNRDQPAQPPMVEQQIEIVVVTVHLNAFLPLNEGKANAEFKDEVFQFANDRVLNIFFEVPIF